MEPAFCSVLAREALLIDFAQALAPLVHAHAMALPVLGEHERFHRKARHLFLPVSQHPRKLFVDQGDPSFPVDDPYAGVGGLHDAAVDVFAGTGDGFFNIRAVHILVRVFIVEIVHCDFPRGISGVAPGSANSYDPILISQRHRLSISRCLTMSFPYCTFS